MSSALTNEQFLLYCDTHSTTPRGGFVPSNIVRLLELADPDHPYLKQWRDRLNKDPHGIYSFGPEAINPLTAQARARLENGV